MIYHCLWDHDESPQSMGTRDYIPALASAFPQLSQECCAVFFQSCRLEVVLEVAQVIPRFRLAPDFMENYPHRTVYGVLMNHPPLSLVRHHRLLCNILYGNEQSRLGQALENIRKIGIMCDIPHEKFNTECYVRVDLTNSEEPVSVESMQSIREGLTNKFRMVTQASYQDFRFSITSRLEAVLAERKKPLRYSKALLMALIAAINELQRSHFGADHEIRHYTP